MYGNLTQIGTNTYYIHRSSNFRTIFKGSQEQHVSFDRYDENVYSTYARIGRIQIDKEDGNVIFDTPISCPVLYEDTIINGNISIYGGINSGHNLTVNGNLELLTEGIPDNASITVVGDLIIGRGIYIKSLARVMADNSYLKDNTSSLGLYGELTVNNDLRIQNKLVDGNFGATSGNLHIENGGHLTVLGDFYTQTTSSSSFNNCASTGSEGIFELYGNLTQIGTNTYYIHRSNNFSTIFAGSGTQKISFDRTDSYSLLGNIIKTDAQGSIVFAAGKTVPSFTLLSDLKISGGSAINGTINLNGHVVEFLDPVTLAGTVDVAAGILILDGSTTVTGTINPNGGLVIAKRNLTLSDYGSITMSNSESAIIIKGDFINNRTSSINFSSGLLELRGNFSSARSFTSSTDCIVQFTGNGQAVTFSASYPVNFGTILTEKALTNYTINRTNSSNIQYSYTFAKAGMGCQNCTNPECSTMHMEDGFCMNCSKCVMCSEYKAIWDYIFPEYSISIEPVIANIKPRFFGIGTYAPTGNYSQSFTDMTVPSVIGDITITHTYNSLDTSDTVLSGGFSFGYAIRIETQTVQELIGRVSQDVIYKTVVLPTGQRWSFKQLADGTYEAQDSRGVLTFADNMYTLKTLDQMTYLFDQHGAITRIRDHQGNTLYLTTDAEHNIRFVTDESGTNIFFDYKDGKLEKVEWRTEDNTNVLASADYEYTNGNLTGVTDMDGRRTTYQYNSNGLLYRVVNALNQVTAEITYADSEGRIAAETDITGNTKTYSYYPEERNTVITDSNGRTETQYYDIYMSVSSSVNAVGLCEAVNYQLTNGKNKYNEPRSQTDINGNTTYYIHDAKGNITKITYPDGGTEIYTYDNYNNKTSYTNPSGSITWYIYDGDGKNLLKIVRPLDGKMAYSESADQSLYAITRFQYYSDAAYDKKGLVQYETGPEGNITEYTYYDFGAVRQAIKHIGSVTYTTTYEYDSRRRLVKETDPDGVVTTYDYDVSGNRIRSSVNGAEGTSITRMVYDPLGRVLQEVGPDEYNASYDSSSGYSDSSAGTRWSYNAQGFVQTKTDPEGNVTTYEYDDYGNVTKEILANTSYIHTVYDKMDRPAEVWYYDHVAMNHEELIKEIAYKAIRRPVVTTTEYPGSGRAAIVTVEKSDYAGRLLEHIAPDGVVTNKTYNKMGTLLSESSTAGNKTTYTLDSWERVKTETSAFDATGNAVTEYEYDKNGKVTKAKVKNNRSGTSVTYRETRYKNDPWGNVIAVIAMSGDSPANYIISEYDWAGRVTTQYKGLGASEVNPDTLAILGSGEDYSRLSYVYDYLGNVTISLDALGNSENMTYYPSGLLHTMTDRNGTLHTVVYDGNGNPLSKTSVNGTTTLSKTYTYDCMGNLTSVDDGTGIITYTYNGKGDRISETQDDLVKTFIYDNLGSITSYSIVENGTVLQLVVNGYDNLGRLKTVSENGISKARYTYDKGRLKTTEYTNGITETVKYNKTGLPISVTNKSGDKIVSDYSYTYYYDGNQYQKIDASGTTTYTYDYRNRLATSALPDGTVQTYTFDDNSNRTSLHISKTGEPVKLTTYTYDRNDRLITETVTVDGVTEDTIAYTYDNNGNMTGKSSGTVTTIQTFDLLNRMTAYSDGANTATFTYYPDNMRRSKTVNGMATEQVWINKEISVDKTDENTVTYLHGFKLISSGYGWYLYNANGNVVQLADEAGEITRYYDYDPYGVQLGETDINDSNPYRYSGAYWDNLGTPEHPAGLYYMKARYYDPAIGRFISEDPALDGTNWYIYAAGNPVMYNDPTGNWIHIALGAVVGGLIGGAMDFGMQMIANGGDISQVNLRSIGASFVSGAVTGGLAAATGGLSLTGQVGASALIGGIGYGTYNLVNGSNATLEGFAQSMIAGAAAPVIAKGISMAGSAISKGISKVRSAFAKGTGQGITGGLSTTNNGKQYSTLYEASTGSGSSRSAHRNAANKQFYNQMTNDTQFKNVMDDFFGYNVMDYMKSGKGGLKNPSTDWVWHHPADAPGMIRLIPKNQHQNSVLQNILHPGPNGQGGFGLFN